jgi:hypothetical protein
MDKINIFPIRVGGKHLRGGPSSASSKGVLTRLDAGAKLHSTATEFTAERRAEIEGAARQIRANASEAEAQLEKPGVDTAGALSGWSVHFTSGGSESFYLSATRQQH